jgi:hypothetical protein
MTAKFVFSDRKTNNRKEYVLWCNLGGIQKELRVWFRTKPQNYEVKDAVEMALVCFDLYHEAQNKHGRLAELSDFYDATEIGEKPSDYEEQNFYDNDGFDKWGRDKHGYDRKGYDIDGYNREGRDRKGYDHEGYDIYGYDRRGYDANGTNEHGRSRFGYNSQCI